MGEPRGEKSGFNVLPNTYVPVLSSKVLRAVLSRLPKNSLLELMYVWPKLINTQPHLDKENSRSNQTSFNKLVSSDAKQLKQLGKATKRKIVDKILFEYWTKGLNLLQLSQVDCQLIVDRPNAYYWVKSTVRDSVDNEVPISLAPQVFLQKLASELSALYLTYIYVCRHPRMPLILIRIQVFDLQAIAVTHNSTRPHIASHKPYFVAIPINSPHIIHSPGNDMVTNIVLQVVERCLPQNNTNLLKIVSPESQRPVRSLESMHIFYGNSRFGNSMGSWTPYADGTVDSLPFDALEKHSVLKEQPSVSTEPRQRLRDIANLRFKGSIDGQLKSEKMYDDNKPHRKKASTIVYDGSDNEFEDEDQIQTNEFSSIAPIQYTEFTVKEKITETSNENESSDDNLSSIKVSFAGSDVFAGLHELSVSTTEPENMVIDPLKIPGYLTGEEGPHSGIIRNGTFTKSE